MTADYVLVKIESALAEARFDVGLARATGVDVDAAVDSLREPSDRQCLHGIVFDAVALGYWLEQLNGCDALRRTDTADALVALCDETMSDRDAWLEKSHDAWALLTSTEIDTMSKNVALRLHPPAQASNAQSEARQ